MQRSVPGLDFQKVAIGCFLSMMMVSCGLPEDTSDLQPLLLNCWTHSMEEDTSVEMKIFRPCDFMNFPLRRFRKVYVFEEDNACRFLELAPNDAHFFRTGRWELIPETRTILISDEEGRMVEQLQILEWEENRLILR